MPIINDPLKQIYVPEQNQSNKTQRMIDVLKGTSNRQANRATLMYPLDLNQDGNAAAISFRIFVPKGSKYVNKNSSGASTQPTIQTSRNSVRSRMSLQRNTSFEGTTIALYMPAELNTEYSADWSSERLGGAARFTAAAANITDVTLDQIGMALKEGAINTVAGAISAITPISAKEVKDFYTASFVNPYQEVLFKGINNRVFNFSFTFTPRSQSEAREVKSIIEKFKFHQMPEFKEDNSSYILYPSEFDIEFLWNGSRNPHLHRISTCAMTSLQVSYGSVGGVRTFADGSPVVTTLSMQFTEMETLTKERIKEGF